MITFKEYYQGDKTMSSMVTSLTDPGGNGKSIMRTGRKHENLKRQEYNHTCPHVKSLIDGNATQISLTGQVLLKALQTYGVEFVSGETKGLGNSNVEVKMFVDNTGKRCGILTKKQNG